MVLAVALGRQPQKRLGPYYSFLTILVCEAGVLGTILALGLQG